MAAAAIFDLDRTLIAGSSAKVLSQKLAEVGIEIPAPPGQGIYFSLYERFGEDPITMRLARYAARLFAGQSVRKVETAGRLAADVLGADVLEAAAAEIAQHRADNSTLVLATTAPRELAEPFGLAAGFDHVLATQYRSVDGTYDGTNESSYLWGATKALEVAQWAGENAINLTQSSAYSDSWYDIPLLALVGKPVAINPDMRLLAYSRARSWRSERWTTAREKQQY